MPFLDERHNRLSKIPWDPNIYELGCTRKHNVVMACLPPRVTGKGAAAAVATNILSTATSIISGLIVGGLPGKE